MSSDSEDLPPIRVELSYTVEGITKAEAAKRASELMSMENNRVGGFSCGTSYKNND